MIRGRAAAAVLAVAIAAAPAQAQQRAPAMAEALIAACAGGAAIGYLIGAVSTPSASAQTALLFCGLSTAATAASSAAVAVWRSLPLP